MEVFWLMFLASTVILPVTALWAMRWAMQHGEFKHLDKIALSIFDEAEPVNEVTDHFPGQWPAPRVKAGAASTPGEEEARRRPAPNPTAAQS